MKACVPDSAYYPQSHIPKRGFITEQPVFARKGNPAVGAPPRLTRVREVMEALDPARAPSERRPVPPKAVVPKTSRRK